MWLIIVFIFMKLILKYVKFIVMYDLCINGLNCYVV